MSGLYGQGRRPHDCNDHEDHDVVDAIPEEGSRHLEDVLLARYDVQWALRRLPPIDRAIVVLMQRYCAPPGYTGPWPPAAVHVGEYLHVRFPEFRERPVPPRTVRHRHRLALDRMARWLAPKEVRR